MMVNTSFFFISQMPVTQDGVGKLDSALGTAQQNAVNDSIITLLNDQNAALHTLDSNSGTEFSLESKSIFSIGADYLFGALGGVWFLVKYITTLVFGASIWIDFFLSPTVWWGQALGMMLKVPLIFLQIVGMMYIIGYAFSLGTGNRI